jgi:hypothetical protein
MRVVVACMLGVLAFSATLVSSAQAKKLVESGPQAFTDEGTGAAKLGTKFVNIECKSHSGVGKVENAFGGGAALDGFALYKGCEAAGKGLACTSAGLEAGEIKTEPLKGEIGWISKAKNEVGVVYTAAKGPTFPLAVFNCGGAVGEAKVFNGVIGKVTSPLNTMSVTTTQEFVGGAEEKNDPTKFEGGGGEPLNEFFLETEFTAEPLHNKLAGNQTQSDTFTNKAEGTTGECSIKKEKEKCKRSPATEINTIEVTCPTPNPEEKEQACTASQRPRPEYGRCLKDANKEGKYTDSNCSVAISLKKGLPHKGKYEFHPIP